MVGHSFFIFPKYECVLFLHLLPIHIRSSDYNHCSYLLRKKSLNISNGQSRDNTVYSVIGQMDGANSSVNSSTVSELTEDDSDDDSALLTDEEIDPDHAPFCPSPKTKPNKRDLKLLKASSLPLIALLNARSLYNKNSNFKTFVTELGIEAAIISETWEREDKPLKDLLQMDNYKVHSHRRPKVKANRQPGGACALIYNENRFDVTNLDVHVPKGVEACWSVFKPKNKTDLIENIAIASVYVSPNSVYKTATIKHVIETIHLLRAKFDNKINYLIGGDLNRLKIDKILDCYGPLRQIITAPTRHSATLENIITDLHTLYQAPECLPPLQVDLDKEGKDSDHNIVILPPITISNNNQRKKRPVVPRPLTDSGMEQFRQCIRSHNWDEVFCENCIDQKVATFTTLSETSWMNTFLKNSDGFLFGQEMDESNTENSLEKKQKGIL